MKMLTTSTNDLALATRAKPFNADLRDQLERYRIKNGLKLAVLARELGTNSTQVSKYLSGKPEGNVEKLESVIADVIKSAELRAATRIELFDTSVTAQIRHRFESIRKTNDFGLISGNAGIGKTCGIQLYAAANPSAIATQMSVWNAGPSGVESQLAAAGEMSGWNRKMKRADWLAQKLHGSNRLIIIDNAHKLTRKALAWLFDFHDLTGCPVALVGNPEILETIQHNDQLFSRIGMAREIKLVKDIEKVAARMIEQLDPEAAPEITDLAMRVLEGRGHLRALRKEIILARELRSSPRFTGGCREAFLAAHTQLVRDYAL